MEPPHKCLRRLDENVPFMDSRGDAENYYCERCETNWSFDLDRALPWKLKMRGPPVELPIQTRGLKGRA
jgi:hypothetical protein